MSPWWKRPTSDGNESEVEESRAPVAPAKVSEERAKASEDKESSPAPSRRADSLLVEAQEMTPPRRSSPKSADKQPAAEKVKPEPGKTAPAQAKTVSAESKATTPEAKPTVAEGGGSRSRERPSRADDDGGRPRRSRGGRRRGADRSADPAEAEAPPAPVAEAPPSAPPSSASPASSLPVLAPLAGAATGGSGELESLLREVLQGALGPDRELSISAERKIALFCDFENIALGVRDSSVSKFDIAVILKRLVEKGKIIVKKAYADWDRYSEYKQTLHEAGIELIDIPQKRYSGKNSADIKMVVDAMDLCYSKEHLDTFVVMSGDSDFSPLVGKLKENNKYVIGVGVQDSSSALLVDNCDEFLFYEDLWRDSQKAPRMDGLTPKDQEVFGLMSDAILALIRDNKDVLWGSMIKQTMQRKMPSFNEGYYGYSTFSELLEDAERKKVIRLKKDQRSGSYIVAGFAMRP